MMFVATGILVGCADNRMSPEPAAKVKAPTQVAVPKSAGAVKPVQTDDDFELGTVAPPEPVSDDVVLDESEVPVTLAFERMQGALGQPLTYLVVQSTADSVVVKSVDLNRGNCSAVPPSQSGVELPKTLKFGQTMRLLVVGCESVLEVSIDTDTGEHTFGTST